MKSAALLLLLCSSLAQAAAPFAVVRGVEPTPQNRQTDTRLKAPESVEFDSTNSLLMISNMGHTELGGAAEAIDESGHLSLANLQGSVISANWIPGQAGPSSRTIPVDRSSPNALDLPNSPAHVTALHELPTNGALGLNSPKGLKLVGNRLFIAEKDTLSIITLGTPPRSSQGLRQIERWRRFQVIARQGSGQNSVLVKAQLLNDIAIHNDPRRGGVLFISDTFGNRIWRVDGLFTGQGIPIFSVFEQGLHLLSPNGIQVARGKLWVVGTDTFTGLSNDPIIPTKPLHDPRDPTPVERPDSRALDPLNPPQLLRTSQGIALDSRSLSITMNPANSFLKEHNARLLAIDLNPAFLDRPAHKIDIFPQLVGGFDGVDIDPQSRLLVGNFGTGEISRLIPEMESAATVPATVPAFGPADFSVFQTGQGPVLAVPVVGANEVHLFNYNELK